MQRSTHARVLRARGEWASRTSTRVSRNGLQARPTSAIAVFPEFGGGGRRAPGRHPLPPPREPRRGRPLHARGFVAPRQGPVSGWLWFEDPPTLTRDPQARSWVPSSRKRTDAEEGRQGEGRRRAVAHPEAEGNARWKRGRSLAAASPLSRYRRGSRGNLRGPPLRPPALPSRRAGPDATRFGPALLPGPLRAALQRAFDVAAGAPGPPSPRCPQAPTRAPPGPGLLTAAAAALEL